ncbi:FABP family protein [Pseudofrankia asymbiotica]|uniref:Peroxynitrite isomerase n=1 Tax=Pseudofrankia asymbiotica TaxID=1834516 RepID=A0A1V2IAN6_9ACTN|nr:FABP family protein [Pseudofrankia asymbiotica]ONH30234.1 fatty acid-binding protein [Pseudofrankia asymbiotica]
MTSTTGPARSGASVPDPHPSLAPLAFLVGTWHGEGVGGYEDLPDFRYEQEITFLSTGRPALAYASTTWWADEPRDGREPGSPLATETGFWRVQDDPDKPGGRIVEVSLAHPFGIAEIYVGTLDGTRIELDSNVVIRTATARDVTRSVRLYGIVEGGDLAYAIDMEASGKPLQPHLSARLRKIED